MSKYDKANVHSGNNRERYHDQIANRSSSSDVKRQSETTVNEESAEVNANTQDSLQRDRFYDDQITKVAPLRAMHKDPYKNITNKELNIFPDKTTVAKRQPLRREQDHEYELEHKEEQENKQEEEEELDNQYQEHEDDDLYSDKSNSVKSPSTDVFVKEQPSHTHVNRRQTYKANNSGVHQHHEESPLELQIVKPSTVLTHKRGTDTDTFTNKPANERTLSTEYKVERERLFSNDKPPLKEREGRETDNIERELDDQPKEKSSEMQSKEQSTITHREHNQFYSEMSNLHYDNASVSKGLANATIFENQIINNNHNNNNRNNNSVSEENGNRNNSSNINFSQGGSNKLISGNYNDLINNNNNNNNNINSSNNFNGDDRSWYYRASRYLLPRVDARFARDAWYVENNNNTNITHHANGNIVEVGIAHCMLSEVRVILFAALTFLSLIFTIVSLPTSQLDVKNNGCYTYWGYKENCDDNTYYTPISLIACTATRWRLQVASAFAVMSLFMLLIVVGISETMIVCNSILKHSQSTLRTMQIVLILVSAIIIIFQLIAWCFIVAINIERDCDNDSTARRNITYGVGFGFSITSWCLVLCAICIFLMTPSSVYCAA